MVVKILSSGAGFSGIKYNENKVSIGSAELMVSENFGLLDMDSKTRTIPELESFLKAWSMTEKGTINKPQFHVAISCKGKEKSGEELTEIARQYIEKMGYQDNPYLIYFHSDTANNHVHIVSSRVNEFGLKINDSFEQRRSQTAMKEILAQDPKQEIGEKVNQAQRYNFSTEAQFKLLLERDGIIVKEKNGQYQFIKYGVVNHQLNKAEVTDKINAYQEPTDRIKQLTAIFQKYKPALSPEKFAEFMKDKFGLELIFHTAKGKDTPYGYTVIDHAQHHVLKGSQVLKLSDLLALVPRADALQSATELISVLAKDQQFRYREFKKELSRLGFELSTSGAVKLAGENQPSLTVSRERMQQLLYNDRLYEASKFNLTTAVEAEIIRKAFFLRNEDKLPYAPAQQQDPAKIILSDKLNSLLATGKSLTEIAAENKYSFAQNRGEVYLIDQANHGLFKMAELTSARLDYSGVNILDTDKAIRLDPTRTTQDNTNLSEIAATFMSLLDPGHPEENENKRKLKRKMK